MRNKSILFALALSVFGCEKIVEVDRSLIDQAGGAGGAPTTGST